MKRIPYAGAEPAYQPWPEAEMRFASEARKAGLTLDKVADFMLDIFGRACSADDVAKACRDYRKREVAA